MPRRDGGGGSAMSKILLIIIILFLGGCATTERIPIFIHPEWNDYLYLELPTKHNVEVFTCHFQLEDGSTQSVVIAELKP